MKKLLAVLPLSMLLACSLVKPSTPESGVDSPKINVLGTREYIVQQRLTLVNEGEGQPDKQNLWIALVRDVSPYQKILSKSISPGTYDQVTDEYGNRYAEFDFSDHPAGTTIKVEIDYRVAVNELAYDLSNCVGELPNVFTGPELHIESANPQILSLAADLSKGKDTVCDQVRAFYNYAGDKLVYTYNRNDWGAQATLGEMGADCTEYASLMIALSRASGIPARYFEGLLYLGAENDDLAKTEHAWLDVYLPGAGWVAMDPTLGRSLLKRDTYFAHYTADHIIVSTGRNPSTLRGASYWTHLYWPGNSTTIRIKEAGWSITPVEP